MPLKASGMQSILNGFLRYRVNLRGEILKNLEDVHPNPRSIMITCIDSRIVASRIVQADPGDTFLARNPGNLVPNYKKLDSKTPRSEEAALEFACVHHNVNTIVIGGHSDCKAMNLVCDNREKHHDHSQCGAGAHKGNAESILKAWLMSNAGPSINKFRELEKSNFQKPLTFNVSKGHQFQAYIDPENKFALNDKFSLVNTLTQMENLKSYRFLEEPLDANKIKAYAMWLDIYNGDVYVFNYKEKSFVKLEEETHENIAESTAY